VTDDTGRPRPGTARSLIFDVDSEIILRAKRAKKAARDARSGRPTFNSSTMNQRTQFRRRVRGTTQPTLAIVRQRQGRQAEGFQVASQLEASGEESAQRQGTWIAKCFSDKTRKECGRVPSPFSLKIDERLSPRASAWGYLAACSRTCHRLCVSLLRTAHLTPLLH